MTRADGRLRTQHLAATRLQKLFRRNPRTCKRYLEFDKEDGGGDSIYRGEAPQTTNVTTELVEPEWHRRADGTERAETLDEDDPKDHGKNCFKVKDATKLMVYILSWYCCGLFFSVTFKSCLRHFDDVVMLTTLQFLVSAAVLALFLPLSGGLRPLYYAMLVTEPGEVDSEAPSAHGGT